jgi:hypothetical protein
VTTSGPEADAYATPSNKTDHAVPVGSALEGWKVTEYVGVTAAGRTAQAASSVTAPVGATVMVDAALVIEPGPEPVHPRKRYPLFVRSLRTRESPTAIHVGTPGVAPVTTPPAVALTVTAYAAANVTLKIRVTQAVVGVVGRGAYSVPVLDATAGKYTG